MPLKNDNTGFVEQEILTDGTIIVNKYEGDWNTIKWLMDTLESFQSVISNLNYRLENIEKRLNIHSDDRKTILNILKSMDTELSGYQKYLSTISKRILPLEDKPSKKKVYYDYKL